MDDSPPNVKAKIGKPRPIVNKVTSMHVN